MKNRFKGLNNETYDFYYNRNNEGSYFLLNVGTNEIETNQTKNQFIDRVNIITGKKISIKNILAVKGINDPSKPYGLNKNEFNFFKRNKYLNIFCENKFDINEKYKCENIIKFIEHLISDKRDRDYILSFLRQKLTTFNYSPIIIYFNGIDGAGKGVFARLLAKIVGEELITLNLDCSTLIKESTSWLNGKLFIEIPELTNKTETYKSKDNILKKLKSLSGGNKVNIKELYKDTYNAINYSTLIISSNHTGFDFGENDRRFFVIKVNKKLSNSKLYKDYNGNLVEDGILNDKEVENFCYYLLKNYKNLNDKEYTNAPDNNSKTKEMKEAMQIVDRIIFDLKNEDYQYLYDLVIQSKFTKFIRKWKEGKTYLNDLFHLLFLIEGKKNDKKNILNKLEKTNLKLTLIKRYNKKDYLIHTNKTNEFLIDKEKIN